VGSILKTIKSSHVFCDTDSQCYLGGDAVALPVCGTIELGIFEGFTSLG